MITAWMLYSAAVGALIGAGALAGDRFCRLLRLPVRWVWIGGMCATLVLTCSAFVAITGSDRPSDAYTAGPVSGAVSAERAPDGYAAQLASAITQFVGDARAVGTAMAERAYAAVAHDARVGRSLLLIWAACSVSLLFILAATLSRLQRARTRWRPHRIGDAGVLVSREVGPAVVGLLRPSIVIPEWLLDEPTERQLLVVHHEDEHRRAGDHAMLAAACIAVCLLPWNLALWWMLLRARLAVELDCDARVLRRGVQARSYGSLLLEIAGRTRARPFGAPALADSPTHLERRLIAMTENTRTPRRAPAAAMGLSALLLGAVACTADLPTSAAIDEMDVAEAQVQAERVGVLVPLAKAGTPRFLIDDVVATEEEARALAPEAIARIEVVKGEAARRAYGEGGENGVISIATLAGGAVPVPVDGDRVTLRAVEGDVAHTAAERQSVLRRRATSIATEGMQLSAIGVDPLIVLDGVIAPASLNLRSLAPESIERVEVVKGPAARQLYNDPRAVNGVILITTKATRR